MVSIPEKVNSLTLSKAETNTDKNPLNLAGSWYVAMPSKKLGKKPKAIQLFGRDLVAWRDGNGTPVIMERYCSHMGASLAIGEVKNGCIQCPFHHWHYDSSGKCVSIPNIEHIPPTARQTTYVTEEKYGYIWVWYGTQTPLFPLVKFNPAENEKHNYMTFRFAYNTKTTVLRVVENTYDQCHLSTVHHLPATSSFQLTILDEKSLAQRSELFVAKEACFGTFIEIRIDRYLGLIGAVAKALGIKFETLTAYIDGYPSGALVKMFFNGEERFQILNSITPIAKNHTIWNILIKIKKTGNPLLDLVYYLMFSLPNALTGYDDLAIWNNLNPDEGGVYIKHDEGVLKYRRFYQSWVNKVEVDEHKTQHLHH